ncbi:MAG: YfhO family protein, partial [Lachnospiraceae bacterium]|nr:YfhO family protein [Lachnospiraceae bacterium]
MATKKCGEEREIMNAKAMEGLKKRKYGLLAALLTACAAVVIFSLSGRLIGGGYTFIRGDLTGQYVPFIRQFLNSLLGPEDLDYSFYISMGTSTMAAYAYN